MVNDFPEEFLEDMQSMVAEYYAKKREITKRVLAEMKVEEKPVVKLPRKRISKK